MAPPLSQLGDEQNKDERPSAASESSQRLWQSYVRTNAWDEIPGIEEYAQSIKPYRKAAVRIVSRSPGMASSSGMNVGEFRTEKEHPIPKVAPEPILKLRRRSGTQAETENFPATEGVTNTEDWVHLTVNGFINLLRITSLYWAYTEPQGGSRKTATTTFGIP